jgi:uncharacterized membrane protein YeiH
MLKFLLLTFELSGTIAFAISGAMVALQKKMDIFGVAILGLVTAVGGGVIRDVILNNIPPDTFKYPIYGLTAIITSIIVFVLAVKKLLDKKHPAFDIILLVMDSLGLAVFTVVGIYTAKVICDTDNIYLMIFVGVVTGVGGGVLRDILAGDTPYIFVKHFYATASLLGSGVCVALMHFTKPMYAMMAGALTVFILRICAARFRWKLPRAE